MMMIVSWWTTNSVVPIDSILPTRRRDTRACDAEGLVDTKVVGGEGVLATTGVSRRYPPRFRRIVAAAVAS